MNILEELRYTPEHEWVKKTDDHFIVGITDFAQKELGDIVYVEIDSLGEELEKGAVFGTVEAVKTVSELFMPFDGKVIGFNEDLETTPESVNEDPYEAGWMITLEAKDSEAAWESLMTAADYQASIVA
ncbi:UNVERIFIED_CONTAM: hypothetical protein GTU68_000010 [Idotea baltica]|nr:hypothetical protein [Idotea baltica]